MSLQNRQVLEELKKSLMTEKEKEKDKGYSFQEYTIDGRVYSSLSNIGEHSITDMSKEAIVIKDFVKLLNESSESEIRNFAKTVENITWLHTSNKDRLADTPIYNLADECSDKVLHTRPGTVERELVLMTMVNKIKTAYRSV